MALDAFLRDNADPELSSWADVDGDSVFPIEDAPVPVWITRARGGFDWQRLAELVKQGLPETFDAVPGIDQLLQGLEQARREDFEDWMVELKLDLIVFPAAGDVGRVDLFTRPESLEAASRNGVVYSNGNRVIRHLGIPTVTVPMGFMGDIQMPVGLTFAGPAYSDDALLDHASAYEAATRRRQPAFLTPTLPSNQIAPHMASTTNPAGLDEAADAAAHSTLVTIAPVRRSWMVEVDLGDPIDAAQAWADGHILRPVPGRPGVFRGRVSLSRRRLAAEMMIIVLRARSSAELILVELPADS